MSETSGATRDQATEEPANAATRQTRKDREYTALRWSLGETLKGLDVLGSALADAHELTGAAVKMVAGNRQELGAVKAYLDQGSPFDYAAFPWGDEDNEAEAPVAESASRLPGKQSIAADLFHDQEDFSEL